MLTPNRNRHGRLVKYARVWDMACRSIPSNPKKTVQDVFFWYDTDTVQHGALERGEHRLEQPAIVSGATQGGGPS